MTNDLPNLDFPEHEFDNALERGKQLVLQRYSQLDSPGHPGHSQSEVFNWFNERLPTEGMAIDTLLDEVKTKVIDTPTMNIGPHMYAYVMAGGNQISIIADLLASAVNQNVAKWHLAPSMTEIEKRVIQWAAEFIGYNQQSAADETGGAIVSSGSAANLTGLTVARNIFFERANIRKTGLFGQKPFIVYASDQTHSSVDKSIELLGIGSNHYRKIPINADYQIDTDALLQQIEIDRQANLQPFCIIGNAGTVNTGAIDPLDTLADIAEAHQLWLHVDGAYGGLAASLPELKAHFKGIERAHSVACDFHKWLYQSFEIGCTLVRDWDQLKRTYHTVADYLDSSQNPSGRLDINEHHFQLSRNAKAFKVWMSFKAFGSHRLQAMIRKDIDLRIYLDKQINQAPDFRSFNSGDLAIACFEYTGTENHNEDLIEQLNTLIIPALEQDRRVFITGTRLHGKPVIRACIINHRKTHEHIDYLLNVIREVGQQVEARLMTQYSN